MGSTCKRAFGENAGRPTRENHRDGFDGADLVGGQIAATDHGLDTEFAQAAGDELGVLGTEIQNEDDLVAHVFSIG